MREYNIWIQEEDRILTELWGVAHFSIICEMLCRNHNSIKNRARKLELKARKKILHWSWTEKQDNILIEDYGIKLCSELSLILNKTPSSIRARANFLGLKSNLDQSVETRKKIGTAISYKFNNDLVYRNKVLNAPIRYRSRKEMTNPEIIIKKIIDLHRLKLKFVGNIGWFIDRYTPDFINEEDKKIVEVYGDYWHSLPKAMEKDKRKIKVYEKLGYDILIIWEKEINKYPQIVTEKLINFMMN